jgi:DNA helicase-2/ATP-dependent DNA helicase PcrA
MCARGTGVEAVETTIRHIELAGPPVAGTATGSRAMQLRMRGSMKFTNEQQRAIDHVEGNLQLIACAGSGKTEVVARRVVTLLTPIEDGGGGCTPANIIAFTFTDKAAAELKDRIHNRCRETFGAMTGLAEMYVGTIHGFCLDLLKSEVPEYMKYEVLNEVQQTLFVDRHSKASGLTQSSTLDASLSKGSQETRTRLPATFSTRSPKRTG